MYAKLNKLTRVANLMIATGALAIGSVALAGTASQDMSVSASISASCDFGAAASLPFGSLNVSQLAAGKIESAPASVKITCTNTGTAAKLYGGSTRKMLNGASEMNYQVFTDASRSAVLGTSVSDGADVVADGSEQTLTLYGRTGAGQGTLPAGNYSQNLSLTVEF